MPFQPGISGNPEGRPKGTGNRQQVFNALVEPHKDALFAKAINMALDGNEAMLRLLLDRILPAKPQDEPIQIELPSDGITSAHTLAKLGAETLRAVTSGEITPEEARRMAAVIEAHQKTFITVEINENFAKIKAQHDVKNQNV